jgi:autotransporter-associated beta strand protein
MPRDSRSSVPSFRKVSAAFIALALLHQSAAAQLQYTVANTFDVGAGSLRNEVNLSNAGGSNSIVWQAGNTGTIALGSQLAIDGVTTLDASGAGGAVGINGSAVILNGAVTFANGPIAEPAFTIASELAGAGSFTKGGSGVVTLTGINSYTGGSNLNAGILNINSDAALGNTAGGLNFYGGTLQTAASITSARNVSLNGTGTFDTNGFTSSLTGVVGGTGELIVGLSGGTGGGILELTNTGNTYSGGTLFQSGTLSIGSDSELGTGGLEFNGGTLQTGVSLTDSRAILLDALGGTFDTAGTTSTFTGLITGGGTLTKISSGTLILTGANTYTGTVINGGVLAVYNDGNLGNTSGAITLNGGILQTLSAFTSNRGVTIGSSSGTIDTYGNGDSLNGVITGAGALTIIDSVGGGVLTLGNAANNYTGGTFVNAGTLQMGANNAMPAGGAMTVASGATFNMNGFSQTTAMGNVTNSGLINVGVGQLNLGTYQGAGTLAVTLQPGVGGANVLTPSVVGTNLNLVGTGTLALKVGPSVVNHQQFTAVTASAMNGLNGQFANILSPAAVTFSPFYGPNSLILTANLVPFASLAATPNQAAIGGALESLRTQAQSNPTGAAGSVIGSLYTLNAPQLQSAFDQIGPIALASMSSLGLAGSSVQSEALGRRMTALDEDSDDTAGFHSFSINGRSSTPGTLVAAGGLSDADPFDNGLQNRKKQEDESDSPWGFFASGVGTSGHLSSINGSAGAQPGYNFKSGGFVAGADYKVASKIAVGLVAGYLYGHSDVYTSQNSAVDNNSARAGVYATGRAGDFRGDAYVGGALDFFSTNRGILFGTTQENATGSPTGTEFNSNLDGSYDFDTDYGIFSPFAGLNVDRLMIKSFSESGAGALDLAVASQTDQSVRSTLGLRQSAKTQSEGVNLQSHWSLGWLHEFVDQSRSIDAQLASGASSVFAVQTADLPRDGILAGVGAVASGEDTSLSLDYTADVRQHFLENVFNVSLRYRF